MTLTQAVGKATQRYFDCTDAVVAAYSRNDVPVADALSSITLQSYNESMHALDTLWKDTVGAAGAAAAEQTAGARGWLDALLERSFLTSLKSMLLQMQDHVAVVLSAVAPLTPRHNAFQIITTIGQAAFLVLDYASNAAFHLAQTANSPTDNDLGHRAVQALTHRDFMQVVADGSRGITATTALLRSETGARQLSYIPFDLPAAITLQVAVASAAAGAVCRYTRMITEVLLSRLHKAKRSSGEGSLASSIPSDITTVYEALAGSQLLAASAAALLEDPGVEQLPEAVRRQVCSGLQRASMYGCTALLHTHLLWGEMVHGVGGCEGRQLAAGLLRALRHVAVQRLQVALLDQLAVHAGMGAGLVVEQGEQQQGVQQGQQGQRVQEACGWEGSSGTWWLAREEERQGRVLGAFWFGGDGGHAGRGGAAVWLEDNHCHVLCGTLHEWGYVTGQLAGQAGVEARPPPLLAARLAARTAEGVYRLCRGQGLEGAYASPHEWKLARAQGLVLSMVPDTTDAGQLPVDTARACLPYWLEAGGWAAAMQADAVAAAMGRLPAAKPHHGRPRSFVELHHCLEGSQGKYLELVVLRVLYLAHGSAFLEYPGAYGYHTLPAAAQADVRRRLSCCGLAATLDHAMRLALSTQQDGLTCSSTSSSSSSSSLQQAPYPGFAPSLAQVVSAAAHIIHSGIIPLLQPAVSATPVVSGAAAGGPGEDSGMCGAGGGRHRGHQLGILYTLSKGAAVLARELDGLSLSDGSSDAAGAGSTRDQADRQPGRRACLLEWAAKELIALDIVTGYLQKEMLQRMGGTHGPEEEGASSGEENRGEAAWAMDAVCVDEVHEALALAARAASKLATPLGLHLAAELAAATEGRGSAVQLSSEQTMEVVSIVDLLRNMVRWWRPPLLLPPAQLLACQPHRLLAAACALAAVLPPTDTSDQMRLGVWLPSTVVVMAAHRTLSGQVRSWMAPGAAATAVAAPVPVSAGSSVAAVASGEAVVDKCGGCLAAPLQSVVRHTASGVAAPYAAEVLALLKIAAGEVEAKAGVPCCEGGRDATGEADGGFQKCAAGVAAEVNEGGGLTGVPEQRPLPDGSLPMDLLDREQRVAGGKPLMLTPPSALPPPLALPPRRQGALPRLRVCGNPRCGNFAERSEGELPLKQCGGCRAVRYCGAECQRAHWREGHRAECRALGAGEDC